jgi:hypothetical protein
MAYLTVEQYVYRPSASYYAYMFSDYVATIETKWAR